MFIPNLMLWIGMAMSDHSWIPRTTKANFSLAIASEISGIRKNYFRTPGYRRSHYGDPDFFWSNSPGFLTKKRGSFSFLEKEVFGWYGGTGYGGDLMKYSIRDREV